MAPTIKNYTGTSPTIKAAFLDLETFIGDMDNADLADDSTVDTYDVVRALNVIVDAINAAESRVRHADG